MGTRRKRRDDRKLSRGCGYRHSNFQATDYLRLTNLGQYDETADLVDDQLLENDEEQVLITWTRGESEVRSMQEQDEAISCILLWATVDADKNCLNLGTNLITKDEATQYGREIMASWGRWNELSIKNGILYCKWFKNESVSSEEPVLQLTVPASGRKEILEQLHDSPVSGGHFAFKKTLNRVKTKILVAVKEIVFRKTFVVVSSLRCKDNSGPERCCRPPAVQSWNSIL